MPQIGVGCIETRISPLVYVYSLWEGMATYFLLDQATRMREAWPSHNYNQPSWTRRERCIKEKH